MEKITFEEGIIRLQQNCKLENVFIEEDFQLRVILDQNEEVLSDLYFSNCFFGAKFGLYNYLRKVALSPRIRIMTIILFPACFLSPAPLF